MEAAFPDSLLKPALPSLAPGLGLLASPAPGQGLGLGLAPGLGLLASPAPGSGLGLGLGMLAPGLGLGCQ